MPQDDYTFLEGKRSGRGNTFAQDFAIHFESRVLPLNAKAFREFSDEVMTTPPSEIYNTAVANMMRAAVSRTVPACMRCNKAMYRLYEHTLAVYRCFPVTAGSESALMEMRTNIAHSARKVVQQIGLYFIYDGVAGKWHAKPPAQLVHDAVLWRCIAFLHAWGQATAGGGARMRLIALFYASFFIHANGSTMNMRFEVDYECYYYYFLSLFFDFDAMKCARDRTGTCTFGDPCATTALHRAPSSG
jgi:hypothetical protein